MVFTSRIDCVHFKDCVRFKDDGVHFKVVWLVAVGRVQRWVGTVRSASSSSVAVFLSVITAGTTTTPRPPFFPVVMMKCVFFFNLFQTGCSSFGPLYV